MGRLFGTDGVRGVANTELTCELAMEIGRAAATILSGENNQKPKFVIGSDTRASSDMLGAALAAGLCSIGADVIQLGVVPTPAVAYLVQKYGADAGVMISASHNPAEFNGIKIFSGNGFKLPDLLEEKIEDLILDPQKNYPQPIGADVGKVTTASGAAKEYIDYIKSTARCTLEGLNIAIDCANGSASATAPELFRELGANVHVLAAEPDGANINRGCGSTHLGALAEYVVANGLDCGVAFDGDADRCLCVDHTGREVDGDMIIAICALDLKARGKLNKNTVVGTIMANFGFGKFCDENDLRFVATKVGDRYVLEEMLLEDYVLGGEQSGHVIFREFATTGDGQLTAVQLLSILKEQSTKTLAELASVMTRYPQTMVNLRISAEGKVAFFTDKVIAAKLDETKQKLGDTGRIVVRPSGTEPLIRVMVEGSDVKFIEEVANDVADVIMQRLGNK